MALSGVEKMVQFSRDLGVEPARAPRRTERAAEARPERSADSDGIKLSLSGLATGAATGAAPVGETASAGSELGPSDPISETTDVRRGSPVDAYQRQGRAQIGQRIAIRA